MTSLARWHIGVRPALILAGFLLLLVQTGQTLAQSSTESQLKAAYLVNFLKYVQWPGAGKQLNLCVFGHNDVWPFLEPYDGRQVAGKRLQIRRVNNLEDLAACQEVFIPEAEAQHSATILRSLEKIPVLTVGDDEDFLRDGGAIILVRSNGRLQFDINPDAMAQVGLKVSTPMLRLARSIKGHTR